MRLLLILLILACVAIQYPLRWGDSGYQRLNELQQQLTDTEKENRILLARNQAMQAEIDDLRTGTQALEERARTHLNMVKPNEVLVRILYNEAPPVIPKKMPITQPAAKSVPTTKNNPSGKNTTASKQATTKNANKNTPVKRSKQVKKSH